MIPQNFDVELRERLLAASKAQKDKGFSSSSSTKFTEVEGWIADCLELDPALVLCQFSAGKNFHGRRNQATERAGETVGGRLALLVFITPDPEWLERQWVNKFPCDVMLICRAPSVPQRLAQIALERVIGSGPHFWRVHEALPEIPHLEAAQMSAGAEDEDEDDPDVVGEVYFDPRIRRMVRLSIASNCGVLLVGPPGTGKSTFLRGVIEEIRESPSDYGLDFAPHDPKWVTAEESWTTRDLVGGETVDELHRLRFSLGHVLDAIREDRWIVIDEVNRADMDKIFGSLMTWMGQREPDQFVDLGRASTAPNAAMIQLGWTKGPNCEVEGLDRLTAEDVGESPVQFMAGTNWRLLGTYNARDAHRVFRFGHALGRRFVRVPIPPPAPAEFGNILSKWGFSKSIGTRVEGLYAAHFDHPVTQLGPALFRTVAEYMRRAAAIEDVPEEQALAEGYLVAMGSSLASLENDELDELGQRIVAKGVLTSTELEWVRSLLPPLA